MPQSPNHKTPLQIPKQKESALKPVVFVMSIFSAGNREGKLNDEYSEHWGVMSQRFFGLKGINLQKYLIKFLKGRANKESACGCQTVVNVTIDNCPN